MIMAQIRINLTFMTIGTLTDYGLLLVLLGVDGGPLNKGLAPGVYMVNKAFVQNEFGYACALGLILAAVVLALTVFYQKYLKVER
jgi:ABC-type sugar transport system permease subunit